MKGYAGLLIGIVCLLSSCSKDGDFKSDKVGPIKPNIQMVLTARHVYSVSPYHDSILSGVIVQIYTNSYYRTIHSQPVRIGTSDAEGKVNFDYLEAQDYFVEATYPGTDTAQITITYPNGAVTSFEDLMMIRH